MIQIFYFSDGDRDGFVVIGELEVWDEAQLFETFDRDGDSRLSLAEFLAARLEDFYETDTDGDGTLSQDEIVEEFHR